MGEIVPFGEEDHFDDLDVEGSMPDVQIVQDTVVIDNSVHNSGNSMLVVADHSVHEAHMSIQENNLLQQQQIVQNIQASDPQLSNLLQLLDSQLSSQNAHLS